MLYHTVLYYDIPRYSLPTAIGSPPATQQARYSPPLLAAYAQTPGAVADSHRGPSLVQPTGQHVHDEIVCDEYATPYAIL